MFRKRNNSDTQAEKRRFDRIDLIQSSYYFPVSGDEKPETRECWINNVSVGGISIDIHPGDGLRDGNVIVLLYKLGAKIRRDNVKVLHCRKVINNRRCGCEFTEDDGKRDADIRAYIEALNR